MQREANMGRFLRTIRDAAPAALVEAALGRTPIMRRGARADRPLLSLSGAAVSRTEASD